jgi:hypothetical protein
MWQNIIVAALVIAATVYAARVLGPRRWRRKSTAPAPGAGKVAAGSCGCGKDDGGCH